MDKKFNNVGEKLWSQLLLVLENINYIDVHTVTINNREASWFKVYLGERGVMVYNSDREPHTKMTEHRAILQEEFIKMYDYYKKWTNCEPHARERARNESQNTSYIFGIIARLEAS